jgi:plasmid maintenance system antidote protein VapI
MQSTPGHCLDRFIWEFESGSVKDFAAKVGYHANRISALKSTTRGISPRLFRRMTEAYGLGKKERVFWGKRLLGI